LLQLTPIEQVKANLALAQAVAVLFQLHSRLNASKLENHPVQKDLVGWTMISDPTSTTATFVEGRRAKPVHQRHSNYPAE